jgi:hypothetical protein
LATAGYSLSHEAGSCPTMLLDAGYQDCDSEPDDDGPDNDYA